MKYLLFAGDNFYPLGGFEDIKGYFDDVECAKKHAKNLLDNHEMSNGWCHIVCLKDEIITLVCKGRCQLKYKEVNNWEWDDATSFED